MALTKELSYDYEIRGIGKNIQQRERTVIKEDGVAISSNFKRKIYTIGMSLDGIEDEETVKSLSSSLWTPQVSASYALMTMSQSLGL
jgi:hypothetical protein